MNLCDGCYEEGFTLASGGLQPRRRELRCGCSICKPDSSGADSLCWSCGHHFKKT